MKFKFKKVLIAVLALAMVGSNFTGGVSTVKAASASAIVLNETLDNSALVLVPGEVKHMRVPLRANGEAMQQATVTVSSSDSAFTLSQATLSTENQTLIGYLSNYGTTYVDFDISVKETAKIKTYPITIKVSAVDPEDNTSYSQSISINMQVLKELAPAQITLSGASVKNAVIGGETKLIFTLKNEGEITALNTYYNIDYGTTNVIPKYETPKIKIGDMAPGDTKYIALPIEILSTATAGLKTLTVNAEYKDVDGKEGKDSQQIYVDVTKDDKAPELMAEDVSFSGEFEPGAKVKIKAILHNYGESKAEKVTIKVDDATTGADGFFKDYYTDSIYVGGIKEDGEIKAEVPLTVSSQATSGNKKVNLIIGYEDSNGNEYTATISVYPEIIGGVSASESDLIISNVKQSPAKPAAGDKMSVSFDLKNISQSDVTDIKIALQGLDGSTFIPVNSEPYQLVDKIVAGKSQKITIPLTVSDKIPEGLNNLSVKITYAGSTASDAIAIPVKDIQNDLGTSSRPKLIISDYDSDPKELRAGSTFHFNYSITNTHSSVAAKNITVTLTQADNIFSVTQGSNSFFIDKIEAGETVEKTVELKVKSDAVTKAYPMKIAIEYEYEGIEPNPETGEIGVTRTEEINLQAMENARPFVDNVTVNSWDSDEVIVGNTATCSFDFYNMGRSTLTNVIAIVEGDFTKADGSMYFIGNVDAGSSSYIEFDVIPNVEGVSKGVLKITYEDSNGDTIEASETEFECPVSSAVAFDPGMMDDNLADAFNPDLTTAKEAILPMWLFILIEAAVAAIFIPVTRKVIISKYKAKLRRKEEEQY